jgi:hypothetical protein
VQRADLSNLGLVKKTEIVDNLFWSGQESDDLLLRLKRKKGAGYYALRASSEA